MFAIFLLTILLIFNQLAAQNNQQLIIKTNETDIYYSGSYALLIGESNYNNGLPTLPEVSKDIDAVAKTLEQHGFITIIKKDLTSDKFDKTMRDFISSYGQIQDARIIIYYAGHGYTKVNKTTERSMGYIVPIDAPNPYYNLNEFLSKAISMNRFKEYAYTMEAKHVLFVFDACFSGSIFSSRGNGDIISYQANKPVRQFITSGDAGETVPDYSYFRRVFIEAITSDVADINKDGYLTGTELGLYLQNMIPQYTNNSQHPRFGKISDPALNQGEFIFVLPQKTTTEKNEEFGFLKLYTEVGGTLRIDSINYGYIKPYSTKTYKLQIGWHKIKIDNFWYKKIIINPNSTVYLKATPEIGTLELTTHIAGELYIDDKLYDYVSKDTTILISLTRGKHKITISGDYYWSDNVYILGAETTSLIINKPFNTGGLQIISYIDGNLFIDNNFVKKIKKNKITILPEIKAGQHKLDIIPTSRSLYKWTAEVEIKPGEILTVVAKENSNKLENYQETCCGLNLEMVAVKGGSFNMGATGWKFDEMPVHKVTMENFWISSTEITAEQFLKFLNDINCHSDGTYNGYKVIDIGDSDCPIVYKDNYFYFEGSKVCPTPDCPIVEVTWYGASLFTKWLSNKTGYHYDLPTEAQWEYAASGGQKNKNYIYSGSNQIDSIAWYNFNSEEHSHPVATKKPNQLGIYDMSGNVIEWCKDWYSGDYYKNSPSYNPEGPIDGNRKVIRGGSWYDFASHCRIADRAHESPKSSHDNLGFRIVRNQ